MLPKKYTTSINNGFVISPKAFIDFVHENDLQEKIVHILGTIRYTDTTTLDRASKHIATFIKDGLMSTQLVGELFSAYALLGGVMQNPKVSITSDLQQSPFIIQGEATLLLTLKDIWSSLFTPQSILAHQEKSHTFLEKGIEITIQKAVKKIKTNQKNKTPISIVNSKSLIVDSPLSLTATKIYLDVSTPTLAEELAKCQSDGIGLFRSELLMKEIGIHPKRFVEEGKRYVVVEKLAKEIADYARSFSPRPVIYRTSDLTSDEYRNLEGGERYESIEPYPLLGFRGAFRYIQDPELFRIELDAITYARTSLGVTNLWLLIPYVRTVAELVTVKKIIASCGLYRSPSFKLWMMVEIPSNVILLEKFIEEGIDGVAIGLQDLTMLMLGIHKANTEMEKVYNEEDPSLLWAIEKVIKTAHKYHISSSLCGKSTFTNENFLKQLIQWGITSVSIHPDALTATRQQIAAIEKELLS